MREAQFNTEVKRSVQRIGGWAHKISDSPTSWTQHITKFTPEKPCDLVCSYRGISILIEGKQMKELKGFGLKALRLSQIHNLNRASLTGSACFVFLNVRLPKDSKWGLQNRLYVFEWTQWRERWRKEGPLKPKDLRRLPSIHGQNGFYDLGPLFKRTHQAHLENHLLKRFDAHGRMRFSWPQSLGTW